MYAIVNLGQAGVQAPQQEQANVAVYSCPPDQMPAPGAERAFSITYAADLNCMKDARGNTVCSDGMRYPPGCPKTPPEKYFSPGVTPDVVKNGMIEGEIPPPKGGSSTPSAPPSVAATSAAAKSGPSAALLIGAGALGMGALAAGAYFLFLKK